MCLGRTESYPPWLVSRPMTKGSPMPFGPNRPPSEVCCGAMIKYWCVAQGTVAAFIQYEESLKSWDHACGVLCVIESGTQTSHPFLFFHPGSSKTMMTVQSSDSSIRVLPTGGTSTDALGNPVRFKDREFTVAKGIVCSAADASEQTRKALTSNVAEA